MSATESATTPEVDAARVEALTPGWRCVWLPQHGQFLAFQNVEMEAPGASLPSVAESDADAVIAAIGTLGELRDAVRAWLKQQEGE